MSGPALQGWAGAWRLFWSFLWRQALALLVGSLLAGALIATLRKARLIAGQTVLDLMPYITTALLVLSCVASFRLLLSTYEIRLPGRDPR